MKTHLNAHCLFPFLRFFSIAAVFLILPQLASAHILPDGMRHGVKDGFAHPFLGLDHLLAMVAVGLWAMQQKGNARWLIPISFVGVMSLGGVLGVMNFQVPRAEFFIAVSLLVLGLFIATSAKFIPVASMAVIGFFALFHGYSHGHEMPQVVGAVSFSLGFILATLLLHAAGMAAGFYLQRIQQPSLIRFAGATLSLCSIYFFTH